jgi:putative ABC transport system permease protein
VLLDDTAKTEATIARLRADLPSDRFELVPWSRLADFYDKTVTLFKRQVGIIRIIIGIIIMLSITNTMMMTVMERTGEIGTAMALGSSKRSVLIGFLSEGTMLGTIGGIAGALAGWVLARVISEIGIPMPPPPGMARGFVAAIHVTPGLVVDAIVLAIVTTIAASFYPAWKASRLIIVDALRRNR